VKTRPAFVKHLLRLLALLGLSLLALQMVFAARIALMAVVDPQSTTFQRSEAWRLLVDKQQVAWSQDWVDTAKLPATIKRAIIASEDAGFVYHAGFEWDAIESAWDKNQKAQDAAERAAQRAEQRAQKNQAKNQKLAKRPSTSKMPKIVGGSTISQQLAKNLLLSGERSLPRKLQEMLLTFWLETFLDKPRLLEIYLNNVEWGEGVFGVQAAARHYFGVDAAQLSAGQAARLAVLLPAPKRLEKSPNAAAVQSRAAIILARMPQVELP
jgi:monofunctional glycosyltransferase